jgi:hypothetical protein
MTNQQSLSNDGNLGDGRLGRIAGREGAERSGRQCHGVWKKECFTSARVNHILRVTKPNTKRATIICPNLLSQIGAWGLRFNSVVHLSGPLLGCSTPHFACAPSGRASASRIRNSLVNSHCCLELRSSSSARLFGGSHHRLYPLEKISE